MKKVILTVMAVFVAVMFVSVAVAATATSTSTPCTSCAKPTPCNTCAKPACNTCKTPCMALPKVSVDWKWPKVCVEKCAPCPATPCAPKCETFKRDVLGQKTPVQTVAAGDAMTDKATKYEDTLVSGK